MFDIMGKVIVAHPGQQHSYRLASALKHAGLLDEYITTVYYRSPKSVLGMLASVAPGDNGERIRSRNNPDLADVDVKQFYAARGFAETLMWRTNNPQTYHGFMRKTQKIFGTKVAKEAMNRCVDAVVCYDVNALDCFTTLEKERPEILRVLDVSIAPRPYLREVYEDIISLTGNDNLKIENPLVWDRHEDEERIKEIQLADYFLAPSDFVANGLISLGANPDSILKLPYGCNFSNYNADRPINKRGSTLELLFVGQCNARKGVDVLADVMELPEMDGVRLTIAGKYDDSREYIQRLLANPRVRMLGMVPRKEVADLCAKSDAFIFPSVAEGMSLACLEAMGSGLPIICTPNSGVSDLVLEGVNGFIVEPGDFAAIENGINQLGSDISQCRSMGKSAFHAAGACTWANYELNAKKLFDTILGHGDE